MQRKPTWYRRVQERVIATPLDHPFHHLLKSHRPPYKPTLLQQVLPHPSRKRTHKKNFSFIEFHEFFYYLHQNSHKQAHHWTLFWHLLVNYPTLLTQSGGPEFRKKPWHPTFKLIVVFTASLDMSTHYIQPSTYNHTSNHLIIGKTVEPQSPRSFFFLISK